jgi:hypothetical protein
MNASQLLAAVAVLAITGIAFAQPVVVPDANVTPGKTRAEVKAELNQAYRQGTLVHRDGEDLIVQPGTRTRAEVRSEGMRIGKPHRQGDINDIYFGS